MKNIDDMPPKCHDCPYWEMCEEPYICQMHDEKKELKGVFKSIELINNVHIP